ncbi:U2 small nuclear ribonucleoprotein A'-like [Elysia marginata]|uniref:U2 small nuclear ribonucleoprotein A'-like n=1 Tax=Elysia marginata TaxID=1093978 RepID=A0AAV4HZT8_9GAST|nr:U2 small nuclear ribonucleoprotein A'-like [Elysia marginata]
MTDRKRKEAGSALPSLVLLIDLLRIAEDLQENLPSLETLVLTNNSLRELTDIDPLSTVTTLKYLSLLGNPIVTKRNYRHYLIYKIPSLRVLDFRKVKLRERETAAKLFKKKKTQQPAPQKAAENGGKAKTFTPGDKLTPGRPVPSGPSKTDVAAIRKAIANAKTLEEIEHLNQLLKTGQVPGQQVTQSREPAKSKEIEREEEEEEEEEEDEAEVHREEAEGDMDEDSNQAAGYQEDGREMNEDDDETEEEEMDDN